MLLSRPTSIDQTVPVTVNNVRGGLEPSASIRTMRVRCPATTEAITEAPSGATAAATPVFSSGPVTSLRATPDSRFSAYRWKPEGAPSVVSCPNTTSDLPSGKARVDWANRGTMIGSSFS